LSYLMHKIGHVSQVNCHVLSHDFSFGVIES
jgi:hypothetical protein